MDMYERIDKILQERKISKRKLSMDINIPYTTIVSMFKRKSTSVDIETIKKISYYLNEDLDYIISGIYYNETLGHKIQRLRKEKNISLEEITNMLNLNSIDILKEIENNNFKHLTSDIINKLAKILCTQPLDLMPIDNDTKIVSKPIEKSYVIFYTPQFGVNKKFLTEEQVNSLYNLAMQFGKINQKSKLDKE